MTAGYIKTWANWLAMPETELAAKWEAYKTVKWTLSEIEQLAGYEPLEEACFRLFCAGLRDLNLGIDKY